MKYHKDILMYHSNKIQEIDELNLLRNTKKKKLIDISSFFLSSFSFLVDLNQNKRVYSHPLISIVFVVVKYEIKVFIIILQQQQNMLNVYLSSS
jgi:hypothetical protein